jgi:cobyrinic acid a,c-diamide synthase
MVGLLPTEARMHARLQAIGYVDVETLSSSALGPRGTRFRGHQFRYSELDPPPIDEEFEPAYAIRRRHGGAVTSDGFAAGEPVGTIVASYVHAHWASNPSVAEAFVEACVRATRSAR